MDLTDRNLETIAAVQLHNMTVEQIVQAETKVESEFHFASGVWWRKVKPFFYVPADMMMRISPAAAVPKPWLALGGYYHLVPYGEGTNGAVVANEISNLEDYSLDSVKKKKKTRIQRALATLRIQRVTDLQDLLNDGYRIYRDWDSRTPDVRVRRSDSERFKEWITLSLAHPHLVILGAYCEDRLIAFLMARAAGGTANIEKSFSLSEFNHQSPMTALTYAYVKICANSPGVHRAWSGLRSMKESLEQYKAELGFQHVSYPAFIHLRPPIRPLVRWLMPVEYNRLMGHYS
jgi:hypothetical protein